jgi:hypothetical protein
MYLILKNTQHVATANSESEAIAEAKRQIAQFKNYGLRAPQFRVVHNSKGVEVWKS